MGEFVQVGPLFLSKEKRYFPQRTKRNKELENEREREREWKRDSLFTWPWGR